MHSYPDCGDQLCKRNFAAQDRMGHRSRSSRYVRFSKVLSHEFEKEDLLWVMQLRAAQNVRPSRISCMHSPDKNKNFELQISRSVGRYRLTEKWSNLQIVHSDNGLKANPTSGYFFISHDSDLAELSVLKASLHYMFLHRKCDDAAA